MASTLLHEFTLTYMEIKLAPKTFINYSRFMHAMEAIELQIAESGIQYSLIVAPSRGGLIPGTVLSHRLGLPLSPIVWNTRDHVGLEPQIPYEITTRLGTLPNRNLLLVEDIIDSGKTGAEIAVAFNKWFAEPVRMDIAAVIENVDQDRTRVAYSGIQFDKAKEDRWIDFWWEMR
jgi:hypoxanthine phosphoribosyltransferase